jgi:DMSO reductase anchor subunit
MNPAFSVLVFTTASGAGYGLLALLGIFAGLGAIPADRWFGLAGLGLALGLITLGLLASTFHLGHPERAWRALSQWRSSWLSREGVMAILTYLPAGILGIGWVFFETTHGLVGISGLVAAAAATGTVFCTAMIYASLKTVRQWHNPRVVTVYLIFALMSGWLWCHALIQLFGVFAPGAGLWAAGLIVLAWGEKIFYWRAIDRETPVGSVASATGLAALGTVRLLDPPHSEENFLMKEMGYRVARKHADKLRRLAVLLGGLLPLALILVGIAAGGALAVVTAVFAAVLGMIGILVERWLFFAEATHKVTLYYGTEAA